MRAHKPRFCSMDCRKHSNAPARFWEIVEKRDPDDCWPLRASHAQRRGVLFDGGTFTRTASRSASRTAVGQKVAGRAAATGAARTRHTSSMGGPNERAIGLGPFPSLDPWRASLGGLGARYGDRLEGRPDSGY
jgi:hypothetical protein